jgi:hypothetical protein
MLDAAQAIQLRFSQNLPQSNPGNLMLQASKASLLFALGLGLCGIAQAQTYDFKGLTLGAKSSVDELVEKHALTCNPRSKNEYGQPCGGNTTIFGEPGSVEVNLDNNSVISRIYVRFDSNPLKFKDMVASASAKLGRPMRRDASTAEWRKGTGNEQQWAKLSWTSYELRIVRLNTGPNPARLLDEKKRKDI